ncbi:hypothetical protein DFH09DRAFT_1339224 [Mycena vulgaris]|nr:hypothetical protein DFH09DRAFT_1339224 [Mycena vulgaris]
MDDDFTVEWTGSRRQPSTPAQRRLASSTHALGGALPPPSSIVFLAIPTLYVKDDDLGLCARLASRALEHLLRLLLPRPPPSPSRPPPTYSPPLAFAGRCARAASAFPRPVHDACDDDHPHAAPLQREVARQTRSTLRSQLEPSHPTKQRPLRRPRRKGVQPHLSAACTRTQPQSLENRQGEARGVGCASCHASPAP